MSKGIIIGIVVILVIAVGGFLLTQNKTTTPTAMQQEKTTQTSETQSTPTSITGEATTSGDVTVTLESDFSPSTITIKKGTKVVWINNSGKTATVDSNPHPVHTSFPEMNLGTFGDGEKIEFVFEKPGTYNYHNHFQSSQGGTVIVEE